MGAPRFRRLRHTADMRIAVWGADEESLIRNAVAATMTVILDRAPCLQVERWAPLRPWPADLPSRIVRTVNEALFHLYVKNRIAVMFAVTTRGARLGLAAFPAGWGPEIEVKAATYHGLRPRRGAGRLTAFITLDV